MLNLSPASRMVLLALAALAVVVLVARLFLKWLRSRPARPARAARSKAATPAAPIAGTITPEARQPVAAKSEEGAASPFTVPFPPAKPAAAKSATAPSRMATAFPEPSPLNRDDASLPLDFAEFPDADASDYRYGSITPVLAAMLPESDERRRSVTRMLRNAGEYNRHAWHNFAAVRYLGIVLPILFFGVLLLVVPEQLEGLMMAGLVVGPLLGWSLPTLMLQSKATSRLQEIAQGIPDMLDILDMCVSQGMTVPSSLGRVARDLAPVYPALSKELKIVTEQSRVGTLNQALAGFSQRCDLPEVHSFTSLLMQTEKMGTSMSSALTEYSDNMRETVKQRADEKSNSASFKLLFPTVLCLMPAVFLLLLGPAIVELSNFFNRGGSDILNTGGRAVQQGVRQ